MKLNKIILFMVTCVIFLSCKNDTKQVEITTDDEVEWADKGNENFTLNLNMVVKENDTFTMYYLTDDMKAITKEKSVSVHVSGNSNIQSLKFKLEEKILPTRILLKFKSENQKIKFLETSLTYEDKEFKFNGDRFFQFFAPNDNIEYNRATATATSKNVDDKFNPTFSSRKVLEEKIDFYLYQ
jgi:hypothetical protein